MPRLAPGAGLEATRGIRRICMSATTRISGTAFLALATAGGNDQWELFDGEARRKPGMSAAHNALMAELAFMLRS